MRSCRLHGYGPNGIGMRRGAKYKVLSTIFNILRQVSFIQCTRVGHRFISAFHAHESVCGLEIDLAHHNGHVATATAHARVLLATHVRIQPPSVQNASRSRAHEPPHDTSIMHREHGRPRRPRPQNRRAASSMISQAATATIAATTATIANVAISCPRRCQPPSCCSHHLQPKQPNPATEHG